MLSGLDEKQLDQMDQALAWEKLDLGEFGPWLNLLTELIQESPLHEQVAEVLVDTDDEDDGPPGLEPIPDNEPQAMPMASAAAIPEQLTAWCYNENIVPMSWTQMCDPLSPEQMSMIHRMEHSHNMNMCPNMRSLNSEVQADVQWQETFQSRSERVPEMESGWESDWESSDLDEPVGLFGLHCLEPCLVRPKSTLCGHTLALMCNVR